jgi:hypothetical protein
MYLARFFATEEPMIYDCILVVRLLSFGLDSQQSCVVCIASYLLAVLHLEPIMCLASIRMGLVSSARFVHIQYGGNLSSA